MVTEKMIKDFVKDYCRDDFRAGFPGGVKIFIQKALDFLNQQSGKTSESLGDYSVSFESQIPKAMIETLYPYRRMKGAK